MPEKHLQDAMATALSIDYWTAPSNSLCACDDDKRLSINFLCMDQVADEYENEKGRENIDKARAARFQEIFLDLTGWHASSCSSRFFLDDRFHSNLDKNEWRLKDGILALLSTPSIECEAHNAILSRLQEDFGLGNLDDALRRREERMSMSSTSSNSRRKGRPPDTEETIILQDIIDTIEKDASIKRAAALTNMSRNRNFDTLMNFLDHFYILDPLRPKYGERPMDIIIPGAHKNVQAEFWRLFEILDDTLRSPDTIETAILQNIIYTIATDARIKSAAAMTEISRNRDLDTLMNFLDRFHILDPLRPTYGDRPMDIIVPWAHKNVQAEFWQLFEIPSHVFVCNSSVCELACDAFLCPVASIASEELSGDIWHQWQLQTKERNPELWHHLTGGRDHVDFLRYERVAVPKRWPDDCSQPLILPIVAFVGEDLPKLMKSARKFLDVAWSLLKERPPQHGRERHLLALPVIGTGGGGGRDMTGEIVENLFHVLKEFVSTRKVDCVIVAADEATYAHAQTVRKETPSSILNPEKLKAAQDLAQLAASGHLSLFLGAGTSIPSGLPSWKGLLMAIRDQLMSSGMTGAAKIEEECKDNLLEMADKLENLASSEACGECLKTRVANLITKEKCHPSLVLALLLSLPSKSIVTTNYDELIETAYRNQNVGSDGNDVTVKSSDLSILPHQPKAGAKKWLLKMHGCVSHPKKMVLTGNDYEESKVLTGIVQANLLTTHLLFCGFSLTDPNYQEVVREVRAAMHVDVEGMP